MSLHTNLHAPMTTLPGRIQIRHKSGLVWDRLFYVLKPAHLVYINTNPCCFLTVSFSKGLVKIQSVEYLLYLMH